VIAAISARVVVAAVCSLAPSEFGPHSSGHAKVAKDPPRESMRIEFVGDAQALGRRAAQTAACAALKNFLDARSGPPGA
jgi:hypothetical protein